MFHSKISNMPVMDKGEVYGIVTIRELADSAFSLANIGGKKGFISNITGRKGLPEGTMPSKEAMQTIKSQSHLKFDVASYAMPHPFKRPGGVLSSKSANRRYAFTLHKTFSIFILSILITIVEIMDQWNCPQI